MGEKNPSWRKTLKMKMKATGRNDNVTSRGPRVGDGRWQREYLTALRGKHSVKHKSSDITIKVGELVMVKEEDKRRRTWKIGRIDVITGVQIKAPKLFLERQVRLLCSLELYCDNIIDDSNQA